MALDAPTFVTQFPEFSDPSVYPVSMISFWLTVAQNQLNPLAWGVQLDYGTALFLAHHLVIAAKAQAQAAAGGVPGSVSGAETSKSIDKVSVSRDTKSVTFDGQAFWNQSAYGIQYWQLARLVGMGPVQVGAPALDRNFGLA